jgi:hypothetical protein
MYYRYRYRIYKFKAGQLGLPTMQLSLCLLPVPLKIITNLQCSQYTAYQWYRYLSE